MLAATTLPLAVAAGCGSPEQPPSEETTSPMRIPYGDDPSQFGELTRPTGQSRGVVVVIHGGFWKAEYDLELARPLAADLARRGWTAWAIEYRRVGAGGGAPATFDDVHDAIERLATIDGLDTSTVLTLGHSAGGHLAVWAAGRHRQPRWSTSTTKVTGALSQAGVLDLVAAHGDDLGDGAAARFLGHPPTRADLPHDPRQQLPLGVPVRCIHGRDDDVVPLSQSADYVADAVAAGGDAGLVEVDGDHFVVIDTTSDAWRRQLELLDELGGR